MAKSKKNLLAAFAILGALLGGGCVPPLVQNQTQIEQPANTPNGSTASKTVDSEYGFSFLYPATYAIDHRAPTEADIKAGYTDKGLDVPKDQYILILASEVRPDEFIGEGAPPVSVMYWANEKNLSLVEWAKKNSLYSGFEANTKYTEETVNGHKAIRYTVDGLYASQEVLIEHNGGVLDIAAAYIDASHPNLETLDIILKNLEFKSK